MSTITYTYLANKLAEDLAYGGYTGVIDDDAGEWFGDDELLGFRLFSVLEGGDLPGEPDMGRMDGEIIIATPDGAVHHYTVATMMGGHVEVLKA